MTKTYKQQLIDKITKEILKQDELLAKLDYHKSVNTTLEEYYKAITLRKLRKDIRSLHGIHFIPNKFPSSKFLSIKLSLESLSIHI
jgi:hypothetical protein